MRRPVLRANKGELYYPLAIAIFVRQRPGRVFRGLSSCKYTRRPPRADYSYQYRRPSVQFKRRVYTSYRRVVCTQYTMGRKSFTNTRRQRPLPTPRQTRVRVSLARRAPLFFLEITIICDCPRCAANIAESVVVDINYNGWKKTVRQHALVTFLYYGVCSRLYNSRSSSSWPMTTVPFNELLGPLKIELNASDCEFRVRYYGYILVHLLSITVIVKALYSPKKENGRSPSAEMNWTGRKRKKTATSSGRIFSASQNQQGQWPGKRPCHWRLRGPQISYFHSVL